jgi:hypothetical protein
MLLAVRTHVHVHCTKNSKKKFMLFAIFLNFLLDQEHMTSGSNVDFRKLGLIGKNSQLTNATHNFTVNNKQI